MKIELTQYLVMSRINLFIIFILFLTGEVFVSCNSENPSLKVKAFYKERYPHSDFLKFNEIVLINDLGDCLNCNNAFARLMEDSTENNHILFIVSSAGAKVDISGYINKDKNNIIWDKTSEFNQFKILNNSGILKLDDKGNIVAKEINKFTKEAVSCERPKENIMP